MKISEPSWENGWTSKETQSKLKRIEKKNGRWIIGCILAVSAYFVFWPSIHDAIYAKEIAAEQAQAEAEAKAEEAKPIDYDYYNKVFGITK